MARPNEPTNLSINNGLDLSLTTYEGLNLSQNSHAPNDNVLNLTAPANATSASSNGLVSANPVEVGLNLRYNKCAVHTTAKAKSIEIH